MIKTKKWIFSVASSSFLLLAHVAKAEYKTLSLEEVKQLCHDSENNAQIFPFTSSLTVLISSEVKEEFKT